MDVASEPGGPPRTRLTAREKFRGVLSALSVAIAGLIGGQAIALLFAVAVLTVFFTAEPNATITAGITTVGFGIGLVVITAVYLRIRDYSVEYVDVAIPSLRDLGWIVGGLVALFSASIVISVLFAQLGVSTEVSSIERQAADLDTPELVLVFIPLSWLVIGPGEELLYRNIVQKSLYDFFARRWAVVIASVIFAAVHLPQYTNFSDISVLGTTSTLLTVFVLALILGFSYERTDNLVVPILIHGTFNAISFALMYVRVATDTTAAVI